MQFAFKVLIGLAAGFAVGLTMAAGHATFLAPAARVLDTGGTMWIAAIRMTVIPLVMSSIIAGVNRAPDASTIGRLGGRAVAFFVIATTIAAVMSIAIGAPLMARISLDPAAVAALRATASTAGTATGSMPTVSQWLIDLVPLNPVKAAADGAMLPLIVFTLAFGIATTRVDHAHRSSPSSKLSRTPRCAWCAGS